MCEITTTIDRGADLTVQNAGDSPVHYMSFHDRAVARAWLGGSEA